MVIEKQADSNPENIEEARSKINIRLNPAMKKVECENCPEAGIN
jgi:RNase P subunit RPR2